MEVLKRDKTTEPFDEGRVRAAVGKAFKACGVEIDDTPANNVIARLKESAMQGDEQQPIYIEDIQDDIERELMSGYPDIAKAYIIYRAEHDVLRGSGKNLYWVLSGNYWPRM